MINKIKIKKRISTFVKLLLLLFAFLYIESTFFGIDNQTNKPGKETTNKSGNNSCQRTTSHHMQPEFERALSLILQRYRQSNSPLYYPLMEISNCVYIQYADLDDLQAEGLFYFDPNISSANKLVIEVDSNYSITDDLTTAFLLVHELTHAQQFVEELSGKSWDCVDAEVNAFYSQLLFGAMINEEEGNSIVSRLERGSQNSQLKIYEDLLDLSWNALKACEMVGKGTITQEGIACYKARLAGEIRAWIVLNPLYQEQCGLN